MKKKLTTKTVENIKPSIKRIEIRDIVLRGFSLRASLGGLKTFYANYRYAGKQRRVKLGYYPMLSLKEARKKASLILVDIGAYEKSLVVEDRHRISVAEAGHNFIKYTRNKITRTGGVPRSVCILILLIYLGTC